jgi:hypothetical protein
LPALKSSCKWELTDILERCIYQTIIDGIIVLN